MNVPPDIIARIRDEFAADADAALDSLRSQPPLPAEPSRSLRCAVFLAQGQLRLLQQMLDVARADYRDVIFWAEYTNHDSPRPKKVRDLAQPFAAAAALQAADDASSPDTRLPRDVRRHFERPEKQRSARKKPGRKP